MRAATLYQLAELTGGEVHGDGDIVLTNALPLQDAQQGCITLIDSARNLERLNRSSAAAVVMTTPLAGCKKPVLIVPNLHAAFIQIVEHLRPPHSIELRSIHPMTAVDPTAEVGEDVCIQAGVSIGPNCKIGKGCTLYAGVQILAGCQLGENCTLYPNVTLYEGTILGDRALLHASSVLGAFGFGYRQVEGRHVRTAQLGWVEVGDDVEIGVGSTIDRGSYGPTKIGHGTKIDNQVQIGHNCHIGQHNLICSQVGVAGSTTTGNYVVLAGQVGVADHITLHDHVQVGAQSGVMADLEAGSVVLGSPASPSKQHMLTVAAITRLPALRKEMRSLQKRLDQLEQASKTAGTNGEQSSCSDEQREAA
ncbi:UDP-3-O-(3-hydroxymyristoyl)glucosamine N-acyltransferase [Aureliella helgolandensis]|uniref:UDP-3-O-(3-hydroxymyristoyl)glucosamine N-acyltransferase n=1 Tax=Aureliella helgolandensis TaxID=2527968 RepID=UPI0011A25A7A|nr:UDP-3-O-(3-hydroxymyristoyl)glucosamine N-acyltransferase [Aureliella helgolandensis]